MTDTPSSILLLRLQSTGSNVNLWGGFLNTALQMVEQASKGYQTLVVTGNATISWTNYTTANTGEIAMLKLTGPIAVAAVLTFPNNQNFLGVWNTAGAPVTIMCAAGIGVVIPNGRKTIIYCDGSDYVSVGPTWSTDEGLVLTNNGDWVNFRQAAALIAAAIKAASITNTGQVLVSVTDTTSKYLALAVTTQIDAITTTQVAGLTSLSTATLGGAGNQQVAIIGGAGYVGGYLNGGTQVAAFTPVVGYEYTIGTAITIQIGSMVTPQVGQSFVINQFNNVNVYYDSTINGLANLLINTNSCDIRKFAGGTWGWN